jgi:uncharacterized glyoxalase superfamily protein PhnB
MTEARRANASTPTGYAARLLSLVLEYPRMAQTVTPYLLYEDAEAAVEFLTRAFGFREVDRAIGVAGGLHVELEVGPEGSSIYLGQPPGGYQGPATVGGTSLVHVLVDDVDAHHERAKAEGATIVEELVDTPFGQRRYTCDDPQGHEWAFATVVSS